MLQPGTVVRLKRGTDIIAKYQGHDAIIERRARGEPCPAYYVRCLGDPLYVFENEFVEVQNVD